MRPLSSCLERESQELFTNEFSLSELEQALAQTKLGKSEGVDGIFPEFLVHLGDEARRILLAIVNLTWRKHVPQQWRKAEKIPILKKEKQANTPNSYRPLALTSACYKVAKRMITNRLNRYLESHNLIDKCIQMYGNRK